MKINLRTTPWLTSETIRFLNNLLRWYPLYVKRKINILEIGSGNSTLFFLGKPDVSIYSFESDSDYLNFIKNTSILAGASTKLIDQKVINNKYLKYNKDKLNLIFTKRILNHVLNNVNFDIVIIDGFDRKSAVEKIIRNNNINQLVVIDDTHYAANWGKLNRSSAAVIRTKVYRKLLRSKHWVNYSFEQEQSSNCSLMDQAGYIIKGRWISSVLWHKKHLFTKLMVNNLGFPMVNALGANDKDLKTLFKRSPYDFKKKKWLIKEYYPKSLDLGLKIIDSNWPKIKIKK